MQKICGIILNSSTLLNTGIEEICKEMNTWQKHRNNKNAKINWQFTTEDAN